MNFPWILLEFSLNSPSILRQNSGTVEELDAVSSEPLFKYIHNANLRMVEWAKMKNYGIILIFLSKNKLISSAALCKRTIKVRKEIERIYLYIFSKTFFCLRKLKGCSCESGTPRHALKKPWVVTTNSSFLISFSLQPDGLNLRYFKLRLFDHSLKYLRSTTLGCNDVGVGKPWSLQQRLNSFWDNCNYTYSPFK